MRSFFFKFGLVAMVWMAALYLLLMGWRGAWVAHWIDRLFVGLACACLAELWLLLRFLRQDLTDLLDACLAAVQGFSGPLRKTGEVLERAAERIENAAGDVAETTETVKQKSKSSLWNMLIGGTR